MGPAAGELLPVTGKKQSRTQHVVPLRKPNLRAAALAESLRTESFLGKVFNQLTPSKRLSEEDSARYGNIFAFQDTGDFDKADAEAAKLEDRRLMGHVMFQRYMSKDYTATYDELAHWLKQNASHPGAQKIFDLAQKKKPKDAALSLTAPKSAKGIYAQQDFDVGQLAQPYMKSRKLSPREKDIVKLVRSHLSNDRPTAAIKRLEAEKAKGVFETTEFDALRGEIAESYYYNGKLAEARDNAAASVERSGKEVPRAAWVAGLAAWRQGDYAAAARFFEKAAQSKRSSAWMQSAAAHWAARSYLRDGKPQQVSKWLTRAAQHPRTFYGIISAKALGLDDADFNWDVPELKDRHVRALQADEAGARALALIDAERPDLAERELSKINPGKNEHLKEALVALTSVGGMPALAYRLGSAIRTKEGDLYDAALYPDVPWSPEEGFDVDRALVYAFIRQESKFDPDANNKSSGAVGLMQLMPATAKHVAKLSGDSVEKDQLKDPTLNISLGQKYLAELLKNDSVDSNLFKLAVAYNAGPGKLARWEKTVQYEDDPLLFIESIPAAETRIFVERVLTNYWIYRLKFDQDTESLDKVAAGEWPVYVAHDIRRSSVFAEAEILFSR